jgi:glyoxylase-like metal-dependent hydrolase (beta-lactamase superfamily II)
MKELSRRNFLTRTSYLGAFYAAGGLLPLPALAEPLTSDSRIAQTPLADQGYASIRQIGRGLYATISDRSKGLQTRSNGGFLVGRDAALMIEGFQTPTGAKFQMDTLRTVTQAPLRALDTHFHFDHTLGNTFYGANGVPVWAHARAVSRMVERYTTMQAEDEAAFLAPFEKRVREARSEDERQHAQSDIGGLKGMFEPVSQQVLALPNHPLDPAKMPMTVDLGGLTAVIETHPGHSETDLIVKVPDQNVVYAGDLLVNGQFPVNIDGAPSPWRVTLEKFAAFDKNTLFVPGHGQICGMEGVAVMRDVFDDLANQADKMYKAGVPVEEAAERYVVPDKFKGFLRFSWGFTIGRTIEQFYAEWQGKPGNPLSY